MSSDHRNRTDDEESPGTVSRRTVLAGTVAGAAVAGLGVPSVSAATARGGAGRAAGLRPVSMAMHIHGSFSEGPASYEAHLQQAREHGVDVIWWTDHDFRVAAHDHRAAVRFDGMSEFEGPLEWSWTADRQGDVAWGSADFVTDPRSPDEPGTAMRISGRGTGDWGIVWYRATSWNSTYSVSMADTTVELDVLAEETGPGREFVFEINASHHPARHGRPAGRYLLQYRIGGTDTVRHRQDGLKGVVELPVAQGEWQRLRLRPVDDIRAIWPDLVAEDNSMHELRIGVRVRSEADTSVVVDRMRFDRGTGAGPSGIELRRSVLDRYRDEYPDIVHYESFEVSLVRHLNWFGGELTMPELPSPPYRDNDPDLTEQMIEFMHGHGALAQWNHPLDVESPESLVRLMIERNNLGADIVEIGRSPFDDLRHVLDAAARNAVFFTAVGVSDDHAGRNWIDQRNNNVTSVWARSTDIDELVAALRAGRAWWTDPARWSGALSIEAFGRQAMGSVLVTAAARVPVKLAATDLPAGATLEIVESPVDYPGPDDPTPATRSTTVPAGDLDNGRYEHLVEPGAGSYVRLQVRDAAGGVVGESNPFWILREPPPHGIPEPRRLRR